jgi:N-acetylmuramoyl-L-alanine amidase
MTRFEEFTEVLKACDCKEYNNVKVVMLAQAIIETGYGKSSLFLEQKNAFGMKYREFLSKYATKYKYYTDSEPERLEDDGSGKMARYDYFCSFGEFIETILCYCHKIRNQEEYKECNKYLDKPEEFLKELAKKWAADEQYYIKVKGKLSEAYKLLEDEEGYKKEIQRRLEEHQAKLDQILKEYREHLDKYHNTKPTTQHKIMLNIGHHGTVGCRGKNKDIKEEIEAEATVKEIIKFLSQHSNVQVDVINQDDFRGTLDEQLKSVGRATKDYDLAIAVHYNANDGMEYGTEVLVAPNADKPTKEFAKLLCDSICEEFKTKNRGVKEKNLAVFAGYEAIENNKCLFVLSEAHFLDDEIDADACRVKSLKNAEIHYKVIKKWLKI